MSVLEKISKEDLLDLVKVTKEEQKSRINNDSLPEVYDSYSLTMLTRYKQALKEEYYDVDKYVCLFDDIRYYEEQNPIIERLHNNIETSMHNKAALLLEEKSDTFVKMMQDYYIIHDVECDLIESFLNLIQRHIDSSANNDELSVEYLTTLAKIRDNIEFKYNSNITSYGIGLGIDEEDLYDKEALYLENMIIRCMYELATFTDDDLTNDAVYAKANALALFLQAALLRIEKKKYIEEYQMISGDIPMGTTARGIVNTAFVQEKAMEKALKWEDKNGD